MSRILVIGQTPVGRRVCGLLHASGRETIHLDAPSDGELRTALTDDVDGIAVLLHDDIKALRYSLAAHHIRPTARLFVAMFDRTAREQLRMSVPNSVVLSPAAISVPSLVAAAIDGHANAIRRRESQDEKRWVSITASSDSEVRVDDYWTPEGLVRYGRLGRIVGQLRPYDAGSKVLLAGIFGLLTVITLDTIVGLQHANFLRALYDATRTTATISSPDLEDTPWILLFATVAALAVLVFTAMFAAGIVNYLLSGRHTALLGRRVSPRFGHVIIVGMGQVGLRLAEELKALGVAVIGIETNPHARSLQLARASSIPVIIGDGAARSTLKAARVEFAEAVVAAGSAEWDNIAVAVSSLAIAPNTRLVIRAGTGDAIDETQSLFAIGAVVDVNGLTASFVTTALTGTDPYAVVATEDADLAVDSSGSVIRRLSVKTFRCECV
ncbi:MAG: NAD-binding protein [Candidatus Nanopelagicales bacterium]